MQCNNVYINIWINRNDEVSLTILQMKFPSLGTLSLDLGTSLLASLLLILVPGDRTEYF